MSLTTISLRRAFVAPFAAALAAALATAFLAAACGSPALDAVDADAERAALEAQQRAWVAALEARDAGGTAELFAEDAVVHVAGMPAIEGRPAIRSFYENLFRFLSRTGAEPETLRLAEGADLAYATGRTENEFAGADGPVAYAGKYVLVWERTERTGGEWRIAVYAVSSDDSSGGG